MVPAPSSDEARLAEFASLRAEIGQRTATQQALIALNLTIAGTVSGIVAAGHGTPRLLLVVVFASSTFGVLWLDHHLAIHQIARYVKYELWIWEPSWERYLRAQPRPIWWQVFFGVAIVLAFVGVAAAAVVIAAGDVAGVMRALWWIGVTVTVLTLAGFGAGFWWAAEEVAGN